MSDCAFCEQGVRPFYDLNISGIKKLICHTCFHLGKHKQPQAAAAVPDPTPKSPTAKDQASTKSSRQ